MFGFHMGCRRREKESAGGGVCVRVALACVSDCMFVLENVSGEGGI